jgi:hypothetical protein
MEVVNIATTPLVAVSRAAQTLPGSNSGISFSDGNSSAKSSAPPSASSQRGFRRRAVSTITGIRRLRASIFAWCSADSGANGDFSYSASPMCRPLPCDLLALLGSPLTCEMVAAPDH